MAVITATSVGMLLFLSFCLIPFFDVVPLYIPHPPPPNDITSPSSPKTDAMEILRFHHGVPQVKNYVDPISLLALYFIAVLILGSSATCYTCGSPLSCAKSMSGHYLDAIYVSEIIVLTPFFFRSVENKIEPNMMSTRFALIVGPGFTCSELARAVTVVVIV